MKRKELERAVRAASRVAGESEFLLIGSQAVHAFTRRAPAEVLLSQECDLYPRNRVQAADRIHATLGRGSSFARRHGFYVDVVDPAIATLPSGWQRRLKPLRFGRIRVDCLDLPDLAVSKLAAGRLKDLEFVGALLRLELCSDDDLRKRIRQLPSVQHRALVRVRLRAVREDSPAGA